MRAIAQQDGLRVMQVVWQDPGQAGVVDVEHTATNPTGFAFTSHRAAKDKVAYAGSSMAEHGKVLVVRGAWNDAFFAEAEAVPPGKTGHDDQIDAVSLAAQELIEGAWSTAYLGAKSGGRMDDAGDVDEVRRDRYAY